MKISKKFLVSALLSSLMLTACAAQSFGQVSVWDPRLRSAPSEVKAGVELLSTDELMRLKTNRMAFSASANDSKTDAKTELASERHVIRVAMGPKPTPGYGFKLHNPELVLDSGVAHVQLEWVSPPKDVLLAQVITYPCIYLSLPKGDYGEVAIIDLTGTVKYSLELTD